MKKHIYKALGVFVFLAYLNSCQTVEEIDFKTRQKSVGNLVTTSVNVLEGGTATVEISTDQPYTKDLIYKLVQVGGDAVSGEDYSFAEDSAPAYGPIGGKIVIPAYATSGTTTISGLTDFAVDNKTAKFELRPMSSMNGVVGSSKMLSFTIDDFTSDDLTVIMNWDVSDDAIDPCDQDLDVFLVDAADNYVTYSASADCEEQFSLPASAPDGDYFIDVDYWAPSDIITTPGDAGEFFVKYTLTLGQVGVASQQISNDFGPDNSNLYLNWSAYGQFGGDGYHAHVVQITKSGSNYTITEL